MTPFSSTRARVGVALLITQFVMAGENPWVVQQIPKINQTPASMMFVNSKTGWICGFFPGVLKTDDGGASWSRLESNLRTERIAAVWFSNEREGWAIGTSYSDKSPRSVILRSADGGRSWVVQKRMESAATPLADIWFLDGRNGWVAGALGPNALILRTRDGGRNWETAYQGGDPSLLVRVRLANSSVGWALGSGTILYTDDGGNTWRHQYRDAEGVFLHDLAVIGPEEAWATGGSDFLLHTQDHGITWVRVPLPGPEDAFLWSLAFRDQDHGWVVGAKGVILSTTSGGKHWVREDSALGATLGAIAVTPSAVYVSAGQDKILGKQTDVTTGRDNKK